MKISNNLTVDQRNTLEAHIKEVTDNWTLEELALGWLRYETIQKMPPTKFKELHTRNLKGELFDEMVDELAAIYME